MDNAPAFDASAGTPRVFEAFGGTPSDPPLRIRFKDRDAAKAVLELLRRSIEKAENIGGRMVQFTLPGDFAPIEFPEGERARFKFDLLSIENSAARWPRIWHWSAGGFDLLFSLNPEGLAIDFEAAGPYRFQLRLSAGGDLQLKVVSAERCELDAIGRCSLLSTEQQSDTFTAAALRELARAVEEQAKIIQRIADAQVVETSHDSPCTCREIQASDPLRHFRGCPLRKPLPPGHPVAVEGKSV